MVSSYHAIAPIYDRMMAHVEYDLWLDLIVRVIERYLPTSAPKIFEVGGGTGVLGEMLTGLGYNYIGSDLSIPMCAQARERNLRFFCADGRNMPVKSAFGLMVFLYDGINYFFDIDDYTRFFTQAYGSLDTGGFLLFDITTEANSKSYFSDMLDFEDFGDSSYVRHSHYDHAKRMQYNDFTVFVRDKDHNGLFRKYEERHAQRVLSVHEIAKAVPENMFSIEGIWDGFTFKKHGPKSERIHFLLKKVGS